MKDLSIAVIGLEGAQGLGKAFLEEKCYSRRSGDLNHNYVKVKMVTYKIVPLEVIVRPSSKWLTKEVLGADAYIFTYNAAVPETIIKLREIMMEFVAKKGTDRFPSVMCEVMDDARKRVVPSVSGRNLADSFGFKFFKAELSKGNIRPIFEELIGVYRTIIDIETRIRRRRQQARGVRRGFGNDEDIRMLVAAVLVILIIIGLLIYALFKYSDPILNTRKFRRRRRRRS
uniref:Uncharacterized protein n=1 Tax=Lotharella oceanica TaxID=641309 RepID=A0A7S2TLR4_9EUKA|mmetsp:Transcript_17537/g.33277  ORF Transcript_17537/g.33277 Transcript_17537/m.33277 type:complete len:229 (+) Transcript_17537:62-748(+)